MTPENSKQHHKVTQRHRLAVVTLLCQGGVFTMNAFTLDITLVKAITYPDDLEPHLSDNLPVPHSTFPSTLVLLSTHEDLSLSKSI